MSALAPLSVVVPFLAAVGIAAGASMLPRRVVEPLAVVAAAASAAMCLLLFVHVRDGRLVYWFAGWHPQHRIALGISFVVDALGAGMASLVAVLVTAALTFSARAFGDTAEHRFDVLMLLFEGAMVGFALTGDVFNLFVFFELMGVIGYALTGYHIEQPSPLQGALAFAVSNSIGGFCLLLGIALVYARTGALNMAQIGVALAPTGADRLVVLAFTLVVVGLLVKGAIVPLHFWLADAHSVAPTPVCMLFSGVMVELGLFGVARVYWTMFDGTFLAFRPQLGHVLMAIGAVSALVGAVMSFAQQHLKRLLAFSTIAHMGLFLLGFGFLERVSLAGVAIYVLGHGLVKASLFACAGIVLHRLGGLDEEHIRGRGRSLPIVAVLFALGGLALAELPPFGTFLGKTLIEDAAGAAGAHWVPWLFGVVAAVTGGAVLRAGGRIFLGWGSAEHDRFASERFGEEEGEQETETPHDRTPVTMWIPAMLLMALGLAVGLVPGLAGRTEVAAQTFVDRSSYASQVLQRRPSAAQFLAAEPPSVLGVWYGLASGAGAVALGALALFRRRIVPARSRGIAARTAGRAVVAVRRLHSGHVGDYVAWLTVGLAVFGVCFVGALR